MRFAVLGFIGAVAIGSVLYWTQPSLSQPAGDRPERQAQPAPQPPEQEFRPPSPPLLAALDANRDGELNDAEIKNAEAALAGLDENKDGQLSGDEVGPAFQFGFGGRGRGGRGGRGGPGGPGGFGRQALKVLEQFDANKDGMLGADERVKARAFAKENRPAGRGFGGGRRRPEVESPREAATKKSDSPDGDRKTEERPRDVVIFGPGGGSDNSPRPAGERLSPDEVAKFPDAPLYDGRVLRTLFFEFENKDWEEELEDFHNTDVEVPAKLIVDGKTYENVGVRFRGSSSYGGVPRGQKRSLNVTMDLIDNKQDLLGYKTLNLLNSHTDPSFLRSVLFSHIARNYIPAPEANLVRVVINGESWGIYINEEQFNKDFVEKWFGNVDGPRWKVPPDFSGAAALVYHGDNVDDYRGRYEIKAKNEDEAWRDLIALCKTLEETPDDRLEEELGKVLDIDRALWFLALDNALIDEDGYHSRGSDYTIYQDPRDKRFHLLPRDSNETFRHHGGGPGARGGRGNRGGPGEVRSANLDPLEQLNAENRPLIRRLLSNEKLRARYLSNIRTIAEEWLDWHKLGPIFEDYRALIADDVMRDTRNLSTFAAFFDADIAAAAGGGPFGGPPGLKQWVEERSEFLLKHPEVSKAGPRASAPTSPAAPASPPTVVINEVMAANNRTIKAPHGKFEDWIELVNVGDQEVDLSGLHLSDDKSKPRKWKFPDGTKLAAGEYLIVWADEEGKVKSGLHANFKLSKSGELVLLLDRNERGNTLIDSLQFEEQRADISYGRYPDGRGKWQVLPPTPGKKNVAD